MESHLPSISSEVFDDLSLFPLVFSKPGWSCHFAVGIGLFMGTLVIEHIVVEKNAEAKSGKGKREKEEKKKAGKKRDERYRGKGRCFRKS